MKCGGCNSVHSNIHGTYTVHTACLRYTTRPRSLAELSFSAIALLSYPAFALSNCTLSALSKCTLSACTDSIASVQCHCFAVLSSLRVPLHGLTALSVCMHRLYSLCPMPLLCCLIQPTSTSAWSDCTLCLHAQTL